MYYVNLRNYSLNALVFRKSESVIQWMAWKTVREYKDYFSHRKKNFFISLRSANADHLESKK
nr:MAG TPA: hypothetical protein [Inoviridae sp.]